MLNPTGCPERAVSNNGRFILLSSHPPVEKYLTLQGERMYLRFVQAVAKREEVENLRSLYTNTIIPALQGTPGCLYACLMQNSRDPDDVVSMTSGKGAEDAEESVKGGMPDHLMRQVRPMLSDAAEW